MSFSISSGFPVLVRRPKLFRLLPFRLPSHLVVEHLRPFAMWTAFPSADYYGRSVALGLAACRRSRVRSDRTSERDIGPSFNPLNGLAGRRPPGGEFERRNRYRPGSSWDSGCWIWCQATRAPTKAPRRAFPLLRALWTN